MAMNRFAVVDTETTGFGKTDRLLEIGIVLVDGNEIIQEWETLVNPERDISNSNIHGITAETVSLAPIFEEVIDEISQFLDGRIFVAHNVAFDARMIKAEFDRLNRSIDLGSGFCTLQATKMKLSAACEAHGISNAHAHRALTDARATAMILTQVFEEGRTMTPALVTGYSKSSHVRTLSRAAVVEGLSSGQQNLRRIARNYQLHGEDAGRISYLDALSSVLSDFELTPDESRHLSDWASDLGLSESDRHKAHEYFVQSIIEAAKRDNFISELEEKLIFKVANSLGVKVNLSKTDIPSPSLSLFEGAKVCFTGKANDATGKEISRESLEAIAIKNGFVPVESVTKKTCDVLIAADKSSMSGKTKKARDYGITVISVSEFLDLI